MVSGKSFRHPNILGQKYTGMRFALQVFSITSSLFLMLVQVLIYFSQNPIFESSATLLSAVSAIFLILITGSINLSAKNWMLWFSVFYFLLYQFGPMVGMIIFGTDRSFLDYGTTFGNGASESSRVTSYLLSGISASFLALLSYFFPPRPVTVPINDKYLENVSFMIWAVSTPFVLIHYLWLFNTFSGSYSVAYSAEAKELVSIVPLHWVFTNLFTLGFFLWLASVPSEKNFKKGFYVFLITSLASSMYGGRIHFIVPLIFMFWYRSVVYGREMSKAVFYIVGVLAFMFIVLMEAFRGDVGMDFDFVVSFLVGSLSKAQYILSLYVDSKHEIDKFGSHYWSAPLIFPYDYAIHGGDLVGQGVASAGIRGDLGHVMSSTLNYEAYINGAGLGSSLVAESFQYGLFGMFPILIIFYLFYRQIFHGMSKRIMLVISPVVFMHFIFSGRDALFFNSWGLVKPIIAFYLLQYLIAMGRGLGSKIQRTQSVGSM